jgi:hypothetical protein
MFANTITDSSIACVTIQVAESLPLSPPLCSTQPLRAQSISADSARVESVRAVLSDIPLGSRIRILTVGHNVIEGRFALRSDTGVVVRQRSDSVRASIARIASVWRPAANIKSGAISGALVGALVLAPLAGIAASGLCDRADCHGAFANGATVGAALGAGVGALAGIGIGALTHHWERVWP